MFKSSTKTLNQQTKCNATPVNFCSLYCWLSTNLAHHGTDQSSALFNKFGVMFLSDAV